MDSQLGHRARTTEAENSQAVNIVVTDAALADLERLREFLVEKDAGAAERATATLIEAIDSLVIFLERGRPSVLRGLRELVVPFGQSSYVVRYAFRSSIDVVYVYRIWHGREQRE